MADIWMDAKYAGLCCECGQRIYVGDRMVYSTDEMKVYCSECGTDLAGPDPKKGGKR